MEPLFKKGDWVGFMVNFLTSTPFAINDSSKENLGKTISYQAIQLAIVVGIDELNPDCVIVEYKDTLRVVSAKDLFTLITNK